MIKRHKLPVAVYLVLLRDGKTLLARRANTGYMDGKYSLPSGHVEEKEGALKAMVREAKEELGLNLSTENFNLAHIMHRNIEPNDRQAYEYIDLYFVCENWHGEPKNAEPEKCSELAWHSLEQLPGDVIPEVRQALQYISKGENYSEYKF
jgi:8-oxo-dGTP diphosphatase